MSATASPPSRAPSRVLADAIRSGAPWLLLLVVATGVFAVARDHLDKTEAALGYLLIVLGASSRSGRRWGLAIAVLAFLCFNFFLLPPYYTLTLRDPLDWVVLGSFLVTGAVAAHLFELAKREAREARARADEVNRFSVVGAEALSGGRAEQGVEALARMLRETVEVDRCDIYLYDAGPNTLRLVASTNPAAAAGSGTGDGTDLLHYAARYRALAVQRPYGDVHVEPAEGRLRKVLQELPASQATLIPLVVRDRTVGVLRFAGRGKALGAAETRFVEALAYYAALGAERVRLVGEEERTAALREASRLKDALLAAVSHDLRTPLTTIKAIAQELRAREESAAIIEAEADRLNRFIADLLDLSRLESDSLTTRPEIVPADDLVGAALRQVSGGAAEREITARVADDGIAYGQMDFVLALRCLVNLIENACKYSVHGPVEVAVTREGDEILFAVADRGPGVPEEERERIFEPFFRGRRVPEGGGTGLGLSLARRLARAQGGDVRYAPREGGGSVFQLALPAAEAPQEANAPVSAAR